MTPNDRFPRAQSRHLAQDANIVPVNTVPSSGQALLDFSNMDPTTFEQFCWWLLKKDPRLGECKRLGGPGTAL